MGKNKDQCGWVKCQHPPFSSIEPPQWGQSSSSTTRWTWLSLPSAGVKHRAFNQPEFAASPPFCHQAPGLFGACPAEGAHHCGLSSGWLYLLHFLTFEPKFFTGCTGISSEEMHRSAMSQTEQETGSVILFLLPPKGKETPQYRGSAAAGDARAPQGLTPLTGSCCLLRHCGKGGLHHVLLGWHFIQLLCIWGISESKPRKVCITQVWTQFFITLFLAESLHQPFSCTQSSYGYDATCEEF